MTNEALKILIVDDEVNNHRAYAKILEPLNLDIITALSAQEALSLAWKYDYFLILMDVHMPEMDGFEAASLILSHPKTSHIPIIFITAIAKDDIFEFKGYESGAVDYMTKPINDTILRSKINVFTELYQQKQKLHEVLKKLEQSNDYKTEFLANMSHEIRTPMNGVIGMTDLLLETDLNEEQKKYIQTIRSSGDALLLIINDILDLSKIEAGMLDMEEIDFNLANTIDNFAKAMAFKADEKKLELIYTIDPELPSYLRGDPGRLRQILTNLVGNAIKFTEKGEVSITCEESETYQEWIKMSFTITDTGIGIPKEKYDILFEQFTQADGSTTRTHGGTGLGLAISKQLVELMCGEISVTSEINHGSTFVFSVWMKKSSKENISMNTELFKGLNILLIDHNTTRRESIGRMIKSWGMTCVRIKNIAKTYETLRGAAASNKPFDIVIVDNDSPDIDLDALCSEICSDTSLEQPRLIIMTALGQNGIEQLVDNNRLLSLTKPISQEDLYSCLQQAIDESQTILSEKKETFKSEFKNAKALIVEDNAVNQLVLQSMLKNVGVHSDIVHNGIEAIEALAKDSYNVVFMDMQMPDMDGIEATTHIRSTSSVVTNSTVPIIAMTANAMKSDKQQCLDAGMNDFLSKPITSIQVQAMLEKWLTNDDTQVHSHESFKDFVILDHDFLIENSLNDEDLLQIITKAFIKDIPKHIDNLKIAVLKNNFNKIREQAHKIRGASSAIGCNKLAQAAKKIEISALNKSINEIDLVMSSLDQIVVETQDAIFAVTNK